MSGELNPTSRQFIAIYNDEPIAFCAILHFPHPKVRSFKRIHRLVVLPDYQGIKIGAYLSDTVARILKKEGNRVIITTSNPAIIKHWVGPKKWIITRKGHSPVSKNQPTSSKKITISMEYMGV